MRTTLPDATFPLSAIPGILALLALGLAGAFLPPAIAALFILVGLAIALVSARPHWVLLLLLVSRSSVDGFKDALQLFPDAWYGFNLAGLFNILGLALAAFFLIRRLARGDQALPTASLKGYALLLIVTLVSLPTSPAFSASVKLWTRLGGALGLALLALEIAQDQRRVRLTLQAMLIAALPPLAVGLWESLRGGGRYFPGYEGTPFVLRPDGTFDHPATLGAFLVLIIALAAAAWVFRRPTILPRLPLALIGSASLLLLLFTYARAEWIGGLAALGVIGLLRYRRFLPALVLLSLAALLISPTVRDRLFGWNADLTLDWRQDVWAASRDLLRHPTLFGAGLDVSSLLLHEQIPTVTAPPHNDYLRMALETGLVGLSVYALTGLALLNLAWRSYRAASADGYTQMIGLALLATLVSGAIISLGDNYLSYASVQWYLWSLVGLLAGQTTRPTDR